MTPPGSVIQESRPPPAVTARIITEPLGSLTDIPQATTEPNQTGLTRNAACPDLDQTQQNRKEQKPGSYLLNSRLQVRVLPGHHQK
jgi:hypothetical protein